MTDNLTLPRSIPTEAALIGGMLLDGNVVDRAADRLSAVDFHEPIHARIFDVAVSLRAQGAEKVTPMAVWPFLQDDEGMISVGGFGYLANLTASAASVIGTKQLIDQLQDLAERRRLILGLTDVCRRAGDLSGEVDVSSLQKLAGDAETVIEQSMLSTSTQPAIGFAQAWDATFAHLENVAAGKTEPVKRIAKPHEWNDLTGGLVDGNFILLGGRPGMGKTGVALSVARGAAEAGHGVLFISREMSVELLMRRMIADMLFEEGSAASMDDIRDGNLSREDYRRAARIRHKIANWPLVFEEPAHLQASSVGPMVRKHKREMAARGNALSLVVVDYLQLLDPPTRRGNREQEVSDISRMLKSVARSTSTTMLALSQLSRAVEQREDRRPQLSDLRDSGSLEQDADVVVFAYRAEYYLKEKEPPAGDARRDAWEVDMDAARNRLLLHTAKFRQGETQHRNLLYFGKHQAVRSADYFDEPGAGPAR